MKEIITNYIRLLTYDQATQTIAKIKELGGYGNIVPAGICIQGTDNQIGDLIKWLNENNFTFELCTKQPYLVIKDILKNFENPT
jgi:acylphosphatase